MFGFDREDWKIIAVAVATIAAIVLIVVGAALLAANNSSAPPACPRGSVPTYIYHSGWICTIAPVTP